MSRLSTRIAHLEAERDARLLATWHGMTLGEQQALLDEATDALIRHGLAPPPDPTQPEATIGTLRQTAPALLAAWGKAIPCNPTWRRQHPDALAALAAYVSARVARYGHRLL